MIIIKDDNFDFAILDLNLGGESSLELIPVLKDTFAQIRILILTGYASIATAVEAIKLGADNYLAKPADTDEILAAMVANFGRKSNKELPKWYQKYILRRGYRRQPSSCPSTKCYLVLRMRVVLGNVCTTFKTLLDNF